MLALELIMFGRVPKPKIVMAVMVVCLGIGLATVSDTRIISNVWGIAVGVGATVRIAAALLPAPSRPRRLAPPHALPHSSLP